MASLFDGVCCDCQRMIVSGVENEKMIKHPAAGVHIDVKSANWKNEFDPLVHYVCSGTGTTPQYIRGRGVPEYYYYGSDVDEFLRESEEIITL